MTLLDFGCGASHFRGCIDRLGLGDRIRYSGLDLSPMSFDLPRRKCRGSPTTQVVRTGGTRWPADVRLCGHERGIHLQSDTPYSDMLDCVKQLS